MKVGTQGRYIPTGVEQGAEPGGCGDGFGPGWLCTVVSYPQGGGPANLIVVRPSGTDFVKTLVTQAGSAGSAQPGQFYV